MSDGTLFKPEKDFTKEADQIIPEAQELARVRIDQNFPRVVDFTDECEDECTTRNRQDLGAGETSKTGVHLLLSTMLSVRNQSDNQSP